MGYLKQGEVSGNGKRGKKSKQPTKSSPSRPLLSTWTRTTVLRALKLR